MFWPIVTFLFVAPYKAFLQDELFGCGYAAPSFFAANKSVKSVKSVVNFFIFLLTIVWKYVNMLICLPEGKRETPAGEGYSGEPHEFRQAGLSFEHLIVKEWSI